MAPPVSLAEALRYVGRGRSRAYAAHVCRVAGDMNAAYTLLSGSPCMIVGGRVFFTGHFFEDRVPGAPAVGIEYARRKRRDAAGWNPVTRRLWLTYWSAPGLFRPVWRYLRSNLDGSMGGDIARRVRDNLGVLHVEDCEAREIGLPLDEPDPWAGRPGPDDPPAG